MKKTIIDKQDKPDYVGMWHKAEFNPKIPYWYITANKSDLSVVPRYFDGDAWWAYKVANGINTLVPNNSFAFWSPMPGPGTIPTPNQANAADPNPCAKCGGTGYIVKRLKIYDGTRWPNPSSEHYNDVTWRLRYSQDSLTPSDKFYIAEALEAYEGLITHPAYTLKRVAKKISGIRKAIKSANKPLNSDRANGAVCEICKQKHEPGTDENCAF